jgi:cobalt-zinc-cadmium efflux system membrane fusion protein
VTATADDRAGGKTLRWVYDSFEGRTSIDAVTARESGVVTAPAGPGTIGDEHEVQGLLTLPEGSLSRLAARYAGPVRSIVANTGDHVQSGDLLAEIESNTSLRSYRLVAPRSGVLVARHATTGDFAAEGEVLFEIASLDPLWVDMHLFGADATHITAGMPVRVTRLADGHTVQTSVDRILPGMATASQSTIARATLTNDDGGWRAGAVVRARITVARKSVALAVPLTALQTFRDWQVVYVRIDDTYEVRPLELGIRDANAVEVIAGINPGDQVVVEQSYLIKADIEKSGASHDH